MTQFPPVQARAGASRRPGWDVLLIALLVLALLQITGFAEATLPTLVQDVQRHPWLGGLLSPAALEAFGDVGPRPGDPIGLLLNATALLLLMLYALADLGLPVRWQMRIKAVLLGAILVTMVVLPTTKLMLLRAQSGPASYSHDGGVIQTEATIRYLLDGRNPYSEDYTGTPMAEWGFSEYRTALYHYPYLPWTFLFSAPFFLVGQALGGYEQRIVYLLLWVLMLVVASALAGNTPGGGRRKLALVALLGLNPIMALDVIFGQNDLFVLAWIVFALAAWRWWRQSHKRGERSSLASVLAWLLVCLFYALACASKPTAWFFAPFLALLLGDIPPALALDSWRATLRTLAETIWQGALRLLPALGIFVLILLPWLIWDPGALYDDVWRWSSGEGETGYQIWGWGASNFVLALGLVQSRFAQYNFLVWEALAGIPVLLWFMLRQVRDNTLGNACWHYAWFLTVFFFFSRFLNENYLGYLFAFMALGLFVDQVSEGTTVISDVTQQAD